MSHSLMFYPDLGHNDLVSSTFKIRVIWFNYFILNRVKFTLITKVPKNLLRMVCIIDAFAYIVNKSKVILTDKPVVTSTPSGLYQLKEGDTATLVCTLTDANPNSPITWRWTKIDNPTKDLYNGPNYTIPNIESGGSGSYSCTARNTVGASEAATIIVDVQCKCRYHLHN